MKTRKTSSTGAAVKIINKLAKDEKIGKYIVPIIPDEARTFGLETIFREHGIYSQDGQNYTPVDIGTLTPTGKQKMDRYYKKGSVKPERCLHSWQQEQPIQFIISR